jgi:hypothetical protein
LPYSKQLFLGSVDTVGQVLYTVPAGYITVVRDIEVLHVSSDSGTFSIYDQGPGSSAATIWFVGVADLAWAQWKGRAVMNAGDQLIASVSDAGTYQAIVSGYLLSAP